MSPLGAAKGRPASAANILSNSKSQNTTRSMGISKSLTDLLRPRNSKSENKLNTRV